MIFSKTPLRIPFCGGLTDLKQYAERFGGATLSVTIDKHLYVGVKTNVDGYFSLKYKDVHEKVKLVDDIDNDLIREAIKITGLESSPLDVYIMADLNSESGLGSSGSLCIGLLNAFHAHKGEFPHKKQLIAEAAQIEIEILDSASGYHDPAICALGGLRLIEYEGTLVKDRIIQLSEQQFNRIQDHLLFFYNGRHYKTKPSLDILNSGMDSALDELAEMKELPYRMENSLLTDDLDSFGKILQRQQELKQKLPGKFNDEYVESVIKRINKRGGWVQLPGGKIGAFVMVFTSPENRQKIREELSEMAEIHFPFVHEGTRVNDF